MIEDYNNPHGKPTKQYNSIEFLLAQVIKGTYETLRALQGVRNEFNAITEGLII